MLAAKGILLSDLAGKDYDDIFLGFSAVLSAVVHASAGSDSEPAYADRERFLTLIRTSAADRPGLVQWLPEAATGFIGAGAEHELTAAELLTAATQALTSVAAALLRLERFGPDAFADE